MSISVCLSYLFLDKARDILTQGANPSAEDAPDDDLADDAETVNDVVHSFRLQPTAFDKKSYLVYLKVIALPLIWFICLTKGVLSLHNRDT